MTLSGFKEILIFDNSLFFEKKKNNNGTTRYTLQAP